MKNRWLSIVMPLLALVMITAACSSGSTGTTPTSTSTLDGATLVQERCSKCHPLTRVESAKHTAPEWKTIVDMMISRGAQLTPDEETVVVDWLAANFGK